MEVAGRTLLRLRKPSVGSAAAKNHPKTARRAAQDGRPRRRWRPGSSCGDRAGPPFNPSPAALRRRNGRAPPPMSAIASSQALYATLQGQQEQRGAGAPSSSANRCRGAPRNPHFQTSLRLEVCTPLRLRRVLTESLIRLITDHCDVRCPDVRGRHVLVHPRAVEERAMVMTHEAAVGTVHTCKPSVGGDVDKSVTRDTRARARHGRVLVPAHERTTRPPAHRERQFEHASGRESARESERERRGGGERGMTLLATALAALAALATRSLVAAQGPGDQLYVGGLFDYRVRDRYQFEFVAQLINDKADGFYDELLPDLTLQTRAVDSGCDPTLATTELWGLAQDWGQPLHGVIGARCSSASMEVATLTRLRQIPQISARSTNPRLSDMVKYSHFYRTCAPDGRQGKMLAELVAAFGYSRVGVISTSTDYATGVAETFASSFVASGTVISVERLSACRISVGSAGTVANASVQLCFDAILSLPLRERPVVLLLSAINEHARQIISLAARRQFRPRGDRGEFVWIGTAGWTGYDTVLTSEPTMEQYKPRVIGLKPASLTEEPAYTQYLQRWQAKQRTDGVADEDIDVVLCPYCAETADAVVALAMAFDAAWSAGSSEEERRANVANGPFVLRHLSNVSFDGVSGPVAFDENGDKAVTQFDIVVAGLRPSSTAAGQRQLEWSHFGRLGDTMQIADTFGSVTALSEDGQLPPDRLDGCDKGADCKGVTDDDGNDAPYCVIDSNGGQGECVRAIENGLCSSRPEYGDDADSISLFSPESTKCESVGAADESERRVECYDPTLATKNTLASMCAEFLPAWSGRTEPFGVCCRADDAEMTKWAVDRWAQYNIQFGQCDNCLRILQRLICQVSCDGNNWRFVTGGSDIMQLPHTADQHEDAGVCDEFCSNAYDACRSVKWQDEVRYLFPDDLQFCEQVLHLQVGSKQEGWTKVDEPTNSDANRLCTPDAKQADTHCVGEGMHQAIGVASTMLCASLVLAELISSWVPSGISRWMPTATVTLSCGFLLGVFIQHVVVPLENHFYNTHNVIDIAQFDTDIFGFLLLPVIIFSSSFNMEHHASVFFMLYIRNITAFAVLGTTIAITFTGGLTYAINSSLGVWDLSFSESMMFGSLISAVDPVATLAAFASVGVDPRVYSLIYGESILNDAVAIVVFSVFKGVSASAEGDTGSHVWQAAIQKFFIMSFGSLFVGISWGLLVSVLYKVYGVNPPPGTSMAAAKMSQVTADHEGHASNSDGDDDDSAKEHKAHHRAMADAAVFLVASLASYYIAEAIHVSGIISALLCGLMCNQFAVRNMSFEARDYAHAFYIVLAEIADHLLMLWVGLLYYFSLGDFEAKFSMMALAMVLLSRGLSVFSVAQFIACVGRHVRWQTQVMMIGAGLRGAVALALVKQMPTSASDEISSATLFIIFWTNVVLGGATTPLVSALKIMNEAEGTLDLSTFEFNEDEQAYLRAIDTTFEKLAKVLLVNGADNVDNANDTNTHGEKKAEWQQIFSSATIRKADLDGDGIDDTVGEKLKHRAKKVSSSKSMGDAVSTDNPAR